MKAEMQEVNNIHSFMSVIDIQYRFERDYNLFVGMRSDQ